MNPVPGKITLGGTQLEITDAAGVDIQGPGAKLLAIDAAGLSRVFYVGSGAVASLSGLTITGGAADYGGGAHNDGGTLTIANSVISGNSASQWGGGIENDGACSVLNSTFFGNSANTGGGIDNEDTLSVVNSTVLGQFGDDYRRRYLVKQLCSFAHQFDHRGQHGGAIWRGTSLG